MTLNILSLSASHFFTVWHVSPYLSFNMILSVSAGHFILLMEASQQLSYDINTKISTNLENSKPSTVALLLIIWLMFLLMK